MKGAEAVAAGPWSPSTTGMARSYPPPDTVGSEASGMADRVADMGSPRSESVNDWSKPDSVDRHG